MAGQGKAVRIRLVHKNSVADQGRHVMLEHAGASGKMSPGRPWRFQVTLLSIPDMSCDHCKSTVTAALTSVPGVASVTVDLDHRTAAVEGDAPLSGLLTALETAGYPAAPA
jgi:copper chaperone